MTVLTIVTVSILADMICTIANVKGGVGKTTAAVYLAAIAGMQNQCLLIDADPQGSATEWLVECPVQGVQVVVAPSIKALPSAATKAIDKQVIIDTPPGHEGLVRAALAVADVVVIPTRVGGVEVSRVQTTIAMIPMGIPYGLLITSARLQTRDFRETVMAWEEVGTKILGIIPERVGIAAGPDGQLHTDGIEAYGLAWLSIENLRKVA